MTDLTQPFTTLDGKATDLTLRDAFRQVAAADPMFESGPSAGQPRALTAQELSSRMTFLRKLDADTLELSVAEKSAVQEMLRFVRPAFALPLNAIIEA